jgi:nicotinamidase-related amidase
VITVDADPYPWPYDGTIEPAHTALLCIDWQTDFCGPGGYVDTMGYDLNLTRAGLEPTAKVLAAVRSAGWTIIHTREGHRADLSDCPPNKRWRSQRIGAGIGDAGPCGRILVRGEPGWEIVPEVAPLAGELVVDKPGKGAFYATDLDTILKMKGIEKLVACGVTTEVCVQTTVREANDRGYDTLVLSDCVASYFPEFQRVALEMIKAQGGIFGWVSDSEHFLSGLAAAGRTPAGAGAAVG